MLIECVLKRDKPIVVQHGNETYSFKPDPDGRQVCEVYNEHHIECFLSRAEMYREIRRDQPENGRAAPQRPDDFEPVGILRIKGIGKAMQMRLNNLGYRQLEDIAAWTPETIEQVERHLAFKGRIVREDWPGQARALLEADEQEAQRIAAARVAAAQNGAAPSEQKTDPAAVAKVYDPDVRFEPGQPVIPDD